LKSLCCQMRIAAFDPVGGEMFAVHARHEALLESPGADRIDFQDGRVLGRRGSAAWVRTGGVERPDLAGRAGRELETLAFLLRFPFLLGDRSRFEAVQAARVAQGGEARLELTLAEPACGARHVRYLAPATLLPRELLLDAGGEKRRIFLPERDWRDVGAVRLPWRKVVLTEAGSPSLEIALQGVFAGEELAPGRFLR